MPDGKLGKYLPRVPRLGRATTAQADGMKAPQTDRRPALRYSSNYRPLHDGPTKAQTGEPRAGRMVDGHLANRTVKPRVLHHRHRTALRQNVQPTRASRPPEGRSRTLTTIGRERDQIRGNSQQRRLYAPLEPSEAATGAPGRSTTHATTGQAFGLPFFDGKEKRHHAQKARTTLGFHRQDNRRRSNHHAHKAQRFAQPTA